MNNVYLARLSNYIKKPFVLYKELKGKGYKNTLELINRLIKIMCLLNMLILIFRANEISSYDTIATFVAFNLCFYFYWWNTLDGLKLDLDIMGVNNTYHLFFITVSDITYGAETILILRHEDWNTMSKEAQINYVVSNASIRFNYAVNYDDLVINKELKCLTY